RWDDVLNEVLVLVITPDHDKIRTKRVQLGANLSHSFQQRGTVRGRRSLAFVTAQFFLHGRWPIRRILDVLRNVRIAESSFQNSCHSLVKACQWREVSHS